MSNRDSIKNYETKEKLNRFMKLEMALFLNGLPFERPLHTCSRETVIEIFSYKKKFQLFENDNFWA